MKNQSGHYLVIGSPGRGATTFGPSTLEGVYEQLRNHVKEYGYNSEDSLVHQQRIGNGKLDSEFLMHTEGSILYEAP